MLKVSTLFFGSAIVLALAWGGVEFLIYKDRSSKSSKVCEFNNSKSPKVLSKKKILGLDGQYLLAFDPIVEKIFKYRVSSEIGIDLRPLNEEIQLECKAFEKNCQPSGYPFYFQSNAFLFQSSNRDVYPAHLAGQRMSSRMTIRLCGQTVSTDPSSYYMNSDNVLFFDRNTGLLGMWKVSHLSEAFSKGRVQEPDFIYRVKSGVGFEPSSCDQRTDSTSAFVQFSGKELLLVNDGHREVETYSYAIGEKIIPLSVSKLSQRGADFLKGSLDMAKVNNYNETSLLTLQSRYFLAPLRFSLLRNDDVYEFPSISWTLRRAAIPHFGSIERTKNEGWIFFQDNEDIVFNEFKCLE